MNDLSLLYSLGGLHVCVSSFLVYFYFFFTVNFMMNLKSASTLALPKLQGEWYYDRLSLNQ